MTIGAIEKQTILDTSENRPAYLWTCPSGARVRLSASAYQLMQQVHRGASFEQIAQIVNRHNGNTVSPADVEKAYRIVVDQIERIDRVGRQPQGAFWFQAKILNSAIVSRVAQWGSNLFRPAVASLVLPLAVVSWWLAKKGIVDASMDDFWPSYVLFLVSVLVHEFGHASACARYGAQPSEIGFTIYFIYPSFYSDVSAAWALARWQRVLVDLGGVYFQFIFGTLFAVGYLLTSWKPFGASLFFILAGCLFSLNPILKFDGYWVVADALGVTNLAAQPARLMRHIGQRLLGRPISPLPWPTWVTAVLFVYTGATMGFWLFVLWKLGPHVWREAGRFAHEAPTFMIGLISKPGYPDLATLSAFAKSAFLLLFPVFMLGRPLFRAMVKLRANHLFRSEPNSTTK